MFEFCSFQGFFIVCLLSTSVLYVLHAGYRSGSSTRLSTHSEEVRMRKHVAEEELIILDDAECTNDQQSAMLKRLSVALCSLS